MDTNTRTILLWSGVAVLVVGGIVMLFASMNGSKGNAANDVNAVYTNAALTIVAQQQTLEAGMKSPTPNPTSNLPTATLSQLPTPTFQQLLSTPLPTSKPFFQMSAYRKKTSILSNQLALPATRCWSI